jgi:hypothetical protein
MSTENPVTTVWRRESYGLAKVAEFPGLPFGNLAIGDEVDVPGQGRAICSTKTTLGSLLHSHKGETVLELMLTLL